MVFLDGLVDSVLVVEIAQVDSVIVAEAAHLPLHDAAERCDIAPQGR